MYDRGLFCVGQSSVCVLFGRGMLLSWVTGGALCGPYVTTGCLEAADRAGASDGTLPTCVTVTSGVIHDQKISAARAEVLPGTPAENRQQIAPPTRSRERFPSRSVYCRFKSGPYRNQGFRCLLDSWRALDEDSMCVCVCPSWRMSSVQTGRGSVASLFSCTRARRVKSCRGSLTHTLRPWALSHIHTMRLGRLGLGPGPRALGSHTLNQYFIPALDSDSVPVTVRRVAGRSTAPSASPFHSPSSSPFLKYEDPWRYLNLHKTSVLFSEFVCDGNKLPCTYRCFQLGRYMLVVMLPSGDMSSLADEAFYWGKCAFIA